MSKSKVTKRPKRKLDAPKLVNDPVESIAVLNRVRQSIGLAPVSASKSVELGQVYVDLLTTQSLTKILNWTICERGNGEGDPVNDWSDFSNQLDVIQTMLEKSYRTLDRLGFNTTAAQGGVS